MTCHSVRVAALLHQLAAARIDLVEWEYELWRRLGIPLATDGSLFYLVPDQQLLDACQVAASFGYYPETTESLHVAYPSELSGLGVRYNIDDRAEKFLGHDCFRRLVFLPLSWSGLDFRDLELIEIRYSGMPGHTFNIWTVPLAAASTAMMRVICAEPRTSRLRRRLKAHLVNLLVYALFDTSYEGDYEEIIGNEVPLSESEVSEIGNAVARIKSWEMRDGEEWIRENLIKLVSGAQGQLPWKEES